MQIGFYQKPLIFKKQRESLVSLCNEKPRKQPYLAVLKIPFSQHNSLRNSQLFLSGLQPCRWDFCSVIHQLLWQLIPYGDIFGGPEWRAVGMGCQRIRAIVAMGQERASSKSQAESNMVTDLTWALHRSKKKTRHLRKCFIFIFILNVCR